MALILNWTFPVQIFSNMAKPQFISYVQWLLPLLYHIESIFSKKFQNGLTPMWAFQLGPTSWFYAKMRAMVPPCPPGWVGVEPSRRTLKLQILWVICMFSTGAWLPGVKLHNISSGKHIPDFSLVQPSQTSGSRHWFLSLHYSIFILQVCRSAGHFYLVRILYSLA